MLNGLILRGLMKSMRTGVITNAVVEGAPASQISTQDPDLLTTDGSGTDLNDFFRKENALKYC